MSFEPSSFTVESGPRKGPRKWSAEEDARLRESVCKHGTKNWKVVSDDVGGGRDAYSCYQHWIRVLHPGISKDKFSREELFQLAWLVRVYGAGNWRSVSRGLFGRTDLQCRTKFSEISRRTSDEAVLLRSIADGTLSDQAVADVFRSNNIAFDNLKRPNEPPEPSSTDAATTANDGSTFLSRRLSISDLSSEVGASSFAHGHPSSHSRVLLPHPIIPLQPLVHPAPGITDSLGSLNQFHVQRILPRFAVPSFPTLSTFNVPRVDSASASIADPSHPSSVCALRPVISSSVSAIPSVTDDAARSMMPLGSHVHPFDNTSLLYFLQCYPELLRVSSNEFFSPVQGEVHVHLHGHPHLHPHVHAHAHDAPHTHEELLGPPLPIHPSGLGPRLSLDGDHGYH
eukprot:ANDGO_01695.mRNA.1 Myb-like protein C